MLATRAAALMLTGAALLHTTPLLAQQKYDLTDLPPVVGTKMVDEYNMQGEDGKFIVAFLGQKLEGEASLAMSSREIIAIDGEVITEYHTEVTESSELFDIDLLDEQNRDESASVLLDVPIRWRLINDVYVPTLIDGDPTEEQLDELEPEPNHDISRSA
ncbi:MAG: hypothetical protein AAGH88_02870 [Planctomycetota bacterium]